MSKIGWNNKKAKLVIANWKMNPNTASEAKDLFLEIKERIAGVRGVSVVICPPIVFLGELRRLYSGSRISFGAQDVFWEKKGSFTGEESPSQVKSVGASFVIIGHSERRALGESDEEVSRKVKAAAAAGMRVVLCVGESERDQSGKYLAVLERQLKNSLEGVSASRAGNLLIAYEPVWAIGKSANEAIDGAELHAMTIFLRKILVSIFGKKKAFQVPILYGGSAEPGNVENLINFGEIDGFLVGHASLRSKSFGEIVRIVSRS